MTLLRLFHRDDPFRPIGERRLAEGELTIGRDAGAGWAIADPSLTLSRRHCVLQKRNGALTVRDLSANGVFLGRARLRAPAAETVALPRGASLHLGDFMIVAEEEEEPASAPAPAPPPAAAAGGPAAEPRAAPGGALLEAFCEGAGLDVSSLSGEDPVELMRRAGAVYREMVTGLSGLMDERTSVRGDWRLDRTTVKGDGNNPFRWTRPERIALDLLRASEAGFLFGPDAIRASVADVRAHASGLAAGLKSAVAAILETLDPAALEQEARGRGWRLGGAAGACWDAFVERRARLAEDFEGEGEVARAFREAYEAALEEPQEKAA